MKIKYFFITLTAALLLVSLSQVFTIPPYVDDVYPVYKSGYFSELERGFQVIRDAFLGIKTMAKPVYAWIFLKDVEASQGTSIKVYNSSARQVLAPDRTAAGVNAEVAAVLNDLNPKITSRVQGGRFVTIMPIVHENRCIFCHPRVKKNRIVGAMVFSRKYDGHIYYSAERIIIFLIISIALVLLLLLLFRWDPGQNVKELFDKS